MIEKLTDIPTMDQVIAEPSRAATLPPEVARTFLIGWATVQPLLIMQALKDTGQAAPATPERFLTVVETVARFGVTRRWLYAHAKQMPHSQPSRKTLLFPERAVTKWFASRKSG